ncbi:MAG: hypothetical protein KF841_10885 [Phycisphaerae bacterium]|nr:hypothetical protein [Phycisphaerae bacterium]
MQRRKVVLAVMVVALSVGVKVEAEGPIPAYGIRYTLPADQVTGDYYVLRLALSAEDQSGSSVGWGVSQVDIRLFNRFDVEQGRWIDTGPAVGTIDGLFWVLHDDPEAPELAEFEALPKISGIADEAGQSFPAGLEYEIESAGPRSLATTSLMAQMNYRLQFENEENPETEGEDETVVVDEDEVDPAAGKGGGLDEFCGRLDDRDRARSSFNALN